MEFTAKQIAAYVGGEIIGDENATVCTFAKIEEGAKGALSFLANPKYASHIYDTQSSIVLVNNDFVPERPIQATLIKTANAYESLAKLMALYESVKPKKTGISPMASVAASATIGDNVYIGPFVSIGEKAIIGNNTIIEAYNQAAIEALKDTDTIINDLYALTKDFPNDWHSDLVHYRTPAAIQAIGNQVVETISKELDITAKEIDMETFDPTRYSKDNIGF